MQGLLRAVVFFSAIFLLLFALIAPAEGARVSEVKRDWMEGEPAAEGKQWEGSFPYFLMLMSSGGSATANSSLWSVPVVIVACAILFIRGTTDI